MKVTRFSASANYFYKTPQELGELLNLQNAGKLVHRLVHNFPKLE